MGNKRRAIISDTDIAILKVLYKFSWAQAHHIAILVNEPCEYITHRLKQLRQSGEIERANIGPGTACNYITAKGIAMLGYEQRNIRVPNLYTYDHSLAEADIYTYLCLPRRKQIIRLCDIATERDIVAAREMIPAGLKQGRTIYKASDAGIHCPDGYLILGDKRYALEVERVMKSKSSRSQLADNVADLHCRFHGQIWAYEKTAVRNALEKQKEIYGNELTLVDLGKIRRDIEVYLENSPTELSKKSNRERRDLIGDFREVKSLDKLQIIHSNENLDLED